MADLGRIAQRLAMSRGVLPPSGLGDEEIAQGYLPHRILVTRNTKDFVLDAVATEFSIISLDKLSSQDPKVVSRAIHRAIVEFELWSAGPGFVLTLYDDGNHEMKRLPT